MGSLERAAAIEEGNAKMRTLIVGAVILAASAGTAAAQSAADGEREFAVCRACHQIGDTAENMLGPQLNGLDGRKAASVADYPYSEAMKNSGITWNEATFKQYIKDPQAMVKGTKMPFAGLKDEKKVADLWAYLSQFDADGAKKK
jgi:cytochrome c